MSAPRLRVGGVYLFERVVTLAENRRGERRHGTRGRTMMAPPIAEGRYRREEQPPGHFVALITDRYWRDTLDRSVIARR